MVFEKQRMVEQLAVSPAWLHYLLHFDLRQSQSMLLVIAFILLFPQVSYHGSILNRISLKRMLLYELNLLHHSLPPAEPFLKRLPLPLHHLSHLEKSHDSRDYVSDHVTRLP